MSYTNLKSLKGWLLGFLLLGGVGVAMFFFLWERDASSAPRADGFAEDRAAKPVKEIPFDAERTMRYLKTLCDLGPRLSGSPAMKAQQELLYKHFEGLGAKVTFQRFQAKQRSQKNPVEMTNLIVTWHPDRAKRIILCGHYDTRPIADQEPRRGDWYKPFLSANDGTSTIAFLMEMAHHIRDIPTEYGIDFVIFDGEEFIFEPSKDEFFLGSEYFAKVYDREKGRYDYRYVAGILFDLCAGEKARFPIEGHSAFYAGGLVDDLWRIAKEFGCKSFVAERGPDVRDDHLALNRVGIPTVDIIDFDYTHWHRLSDTPDKCSPETFKQLATVLTVWLQRIR